MAINVFDSFLKEFEQPITAFVSTSVSKFSRPTSMARCAPP